MRSRTILRIGVAMVLFTLTAQGAFTLMQSRFQRDSLPRKLRTGWFYAEGSDGDLLSYQGGFVFSLEPATLAEIRRQDLAFFRDIDAPQNATKRHYFPRCQWRKTPIDRGATPYNFASAAEHSWVWPKGIETALAQIGSYYCGDGGRYLYVIPSLGIVAAHASDR